jgi:hypothetical protein
MIKIEKNENFPKFFNVFAFGKFIDQVQGRAKAVRMASKIAKANNEPMIINDGVIEKTSN